MSTSQSQCVKLKLNCRVASISFHVDFLALTHNPVTSLFNHLNTRQYVSNFISVGIESDPYGDTTSLERLIQIIPYS